MSTLTQPGKKILRQFRSLLSFEERGYAYPISTEIDLTWRCALNCKGCHSKWLHGDQELEPDQIIRILRQFQSIGLKSITWAGGGDPMESPHWKFAVSNAFIWKFKQAMYTYFPHPDQDKVTFLDNTMEFVYSHPFNTRGLKRQCGRRCTWTAGFLLDKDNWSKIPSMIGTVNLSFFDFVDFRPLAPINTPDPPELDYKWVPDAMELLREFYSDHPQVRWAEYKFLDLLKPDTGRCYSECLSTDFTTIVGPNGDMYECLNRRGFPDSVLGNILTESITAIWDRKNHRRNSFEGCRLLCRNHEMNKELFQILGPAPNHEAFV